MYVTLYMGNSGGFKFPNFDQKNFFHVFFSLDILLWAGRIMKE